MLSTADVSISHTVSLVVKDVVDTNAVLCNVLSTADSSFFITHFLLQKEQCATCICVTVTSDSNLHS